MQHSATRMFTVVYPRGKCRDSSKPPGNTLHEEQTSGGSKDRQYKVFLLMFEFAQAPHYPEPKGCLTQPMGIDHAGPLESPT